MVKRTAGRCCQRIRRISKRFARIWTSVADQSIGIGFSGHKRNIRWITKVESLGANVERATQLTKGNFSATRHEGKVAKRIRRWKHIGCEEDDNFDEVS